MITIEEPHVPPQIDQGYPPGSPIHWGSDLLCIHDAYMTMMQALTLPSETIATKLKPLTMTAHCPTLIRADYPEEACRVRTVTASWFCGCVGVPDGKGVQESLRSAYTDPVSLPALPMLFLGFLEPLSPSSRTNKCSTHSG